MNLIQLKLTAAIMIGGDIQKRGTIIEVSEHEARTLLYRGRAELVGGELSDAGPLSAALTGVDTRGDLNPLDENGVADLHNIDIESLSYEELQAYAARLHSELDTSLPQDELLTAVKQSEIPKPKAEQTMNPEDAKPVIATGASEEVKPDAGSKVVKAAKSAKADTKKE